MQPNFAEVDFVVTDSSTCAKIIGFSFANDGNSLLDRTCASSVLFHLRVGGDFDCNNTYT